MVVEGAGECFQAVVVRVMRYGTAFSSVAARQRVARGYVHDTKVEGYVFIDPPHATEAHHASTYEP